MKRMLLLSILLFSLLAAPVFAGTVISNSKDWRDVYSVVQYGYLTGNEPKFLVSEKHSLLILNEVSKLDEVEIYSSTKSPYVIGYKGILESNGYAAKEYSETSFNIFLAKRLEDINSYIIIDEAYSYNAISVAPYAVASKSYVLFANKENIVQISGFLASKDVNKILIYGYVDREVKQALQDYNPEIINKENDKFENNIEIVKKFKSLKEAKQVTLTNGNFIEASLMSDFEPNLFIGKSNVPDSIKEYITTSDIEVGVLVGNDLIDTATMIRRQTGISTFVKFARSAREQNEVVEKIEGLDLFYLPKVNLNVSIESVNYNSLSKQLLVKVKNNGDVAAYIKGTYTLKTADNSMTVGDADPGFIEAGNTKSISYDLESVSNTEGMTADIFFLFGESKRSLEYKLEGSVSVSAIDTNDDSTIEIDKVEYSKGQNRLYVYIKNTGKEDVYVNTEALDVMVIDTKMILGSSKTIKIPAGATKYSLIKADISNDDLINNENVKIKAYYGKTEDALAKIAEKEVVLGIKAYDLMLLLPLLMILLLIIIIVAVIRKKKKKER